MRSVILIHRANFEDFEFVIYVAEKRETFESSLFFLFVDLHLKEISLSMIRI